MAIGFYAVSAFANILQTIPAQNPAVAADPTGKLWRVSEITAASALVSIFGMGAFVAMAWISAMGARAQSKD